LWKHQKIHNGSSLSPFKIRTFQRFISILPSQHQVANMNPSVVDDLGFVYFFSRCFMISATEFQKVVHFYDPNARFVWRYSTITALSSSEASDGVTKQILLRLLFH
jgi:hypothetical protein